MWDKEEDINIGGKKRKKLSIRIKVDLYAVCLSKIIYCLLLYLKTILIPPPPHHHHQILGISITRRKEFRKYRPKLFDLEEDKTKD